MKWSLYLGQVRGIRLQMHWTFLLLVAWIVMSLASRGAAVPEIVGGVMLLLAVFACVVLHELGHALTAQRFGIQTRDITLLPIGGIARLERMPERPGEEFLVAVAGPMVNVVIASALGIVLLAFGSLEPMTAAIDVRAGFFGQLMWINVILVLFNLLPAFPMDGGRILRSLLAMRMEYARATSIAASVGQIMAVVFGAIGVLGWNPFLVFIAIFVYFGAQAEAQQVQVRSELMGVKVRDAMLSDFFVLSGHHSLGDAAQQLLAGSQQDFPVKSDGRLLGMLYRPRLVAALKEFGSDTAVADVVKPDFPTLDPEQPLHEALAQLRMAGSTSAPVVDARGRLVGLLTLENVGEWLILRSALHAS
jgi:Zn-dependent protease/predicted transcriptional regulator